MVFKHFAQHFAELEQRYHTLLEQHGYQQLLVAVERQNVSSLMIWTIHLRSTLSLRHWFYYRNPFCCDLAIG